MRPLTLRLRVATLVFTLAPAVGWAQIPQVSVEDTAILGGSAAYAAFRVVLSAPSSQAIVIGYATEDGDSNPPAMAGVDYVAASGSLTFGPGRTTHSFAVALITNTGNDLYKTFRVQITASPVGAVTVARATAICGISGRAEPGGVAMYRAYNPTTDYHFFTTSASSRDFAVNTLGFRDESDPVPFFVFRTQEAGLEPLFRLYNPNRGRHYYTLGAGNRDYLMALGMTYEGDEGFLYSDPNPGGQELFRLYNTSTGTHLFTADTAQKDGILALFPGVWQQHSSVGFVPTPAWLGTRPTELVVSGDRLYFVAYPERTQDREIWGVDSAGTVTTLAIFPRAEYPFGPPRQLTALNGLLFFEVITGVVRVSALSGASVRLYRTDGSQAGTFSLASALDLCLIGEAGGAMLYNSRLDGVYRTLGSPSDSVQLASSYGAKTCAPRAASANGVRFFANAYDRTLWRSDGTPPGTYSVWTIAGNGLPAEITHVTPTRVHFAFDDGTSGSELWMTDGTSAGTTLLKDIQPGSMGSSPSNLTISGSTVFFAADDGTSGRELWKTDGTTVGTVLVKDIQPGSASSGPAQLAVVNGVLYFAADDGSGGVELWKSDGTAAGTTLVKDINPGSGPSSPAGFVARDGLVYFAANDGVNGVELWRTDGTEAGTLPVADIAPGVASSSPQSLAVFAGALYFSADDGRNGRELWKSDGTSAGTVMVTDSR